MKNPYQSRMRPRPAGDISFNGTFGTAPTDTVVPNFLADRGMAFTTVPGSSLDLSSIQRTPPDQAPVPNPTPEPTGLAAVPAWAWILGAVVLVGGVYIVTKK